METLAGALEALGFGPGDAKQIIDIGSEIGRRRSEVGDARKAAERAGAIEQAANRFVTFGPDGSIERVDGYAIFDAAVRQNGEKAVLDTLAAHGKTIVDIPKLRELVDRAERGGGAPNAEEALLRQVAKEHATALQEMLKDTGESFDADHMPADRLEDLVLSNTKALKSWVLGQRRLEADARDRQTAGDQRNAELYHQLSALDAADAKAIPHYGELVPELANRFNGLWDRPLADPQRQMVPAALHRLVTDAVMFHDLRGRVRGYIDAAVKSQVDTKVAAELTRRGITPAGGETAVTDTTEEAAAVAAPASRVQPRYDETGPRFVKRRAAVASA